MVRLGQYVSGQSFLHRMDPRVKLVAVVALSLCILRTDTPGAVLSTLCLLAVALASRIAPRLILRALLPVVPFLVLLFLLHSLFTEGTSIVRDFPFPSREGLVTGLLVAWRFFNLILAAALLTLTTSPSELALGIERLLSPLHFLRIPSHHVGTMISLALRFVPSLLEEYERIKEAQTARGLNLRNGSPATRLRKLSGLVVPLALGIFRRADELVAAIEGRGYGQGRRTHLRELRFSRSDGAALCVIVLLILALGVLRMTG
jgi:energy-coupling factor transporter transmembrane protein EcfT